MASRYFTEIFKNRRGHWVWHRRHRQNGKVVSSGQAYQRRRVMVPLLRKMHPLDLIVDLTAR